MISFGLVYWMEDRLFACLFLSKVIITVLSKCDLLPYFRRRVANLFTIERFEMELVSSVYPINPL